MTVINFSPKDENPWINKLAKRLITLNTRQKVNPTFTLGAFLSTFVPHEKTWKFFFWFSKMETRSKLRFCIPSTDESKLSTLISHGNHLCAATFGEKLSMRQTARRVRLISIIHHFIFFSCIWVIIWWVNYRDVSPESTELPPTVKKHFS